MKKNYISPATALMRLASAETLMAGSLPISDSTVDDGWAKKDDWSIWNEDAPVDAPEEDAD